MDHSSTSKCLDPQSEARRLMFLQLYAPRRPMDQLLDQYRVTPTNPEPPLTHFAIPLDSGVVYAYADKHGLTEYLPRFPEIIAPVTLRKFRDHVSEYAQYELDFCWPFRPTADCSFILALYSNYTMEDKMLIEEDQEDVIQMVQEAVGLDKCVRPKWYFDVHDEWRPE